MTETAFQASRPTERSDRQPARLWALIEVGNVRANAIVRDLSTAGFGVETSRAIPVGSTIAVTLGSAPRFLANVIQHANGRYGCRLETPLAQDELAALTKDGPFASMPPVAPGRGAEAVEFRLPVGTRVAVILSAAATCWTALLALGFAKFA